MTSTNPDAKPPGVHKLGAHGLLVRAAAILSGFFGALMIFADLAELVTRGGGDPVRVLLTCSWGAAVLICAGAAWRAPLHRGEG
jgi:hypothetical protein